HVGLSRRHSRQCRVREGYGLDRLEVHAVPPRGGAGEAVGWHVLAGRRRYSPQGDRRGGQAVRRGEETPASTARDIVRGVMEDIIGPHVQTHRATTRKEVA